MFVGCCPTWFATFFRVKCENNIEHHEIQQFNISSNNKELPEKGVKKEKTAKENQNGGNIYTN
jgi:uncharacterized CHY-type Zn-finger protein